MVRYLTMKLISKNLNYVKGRANPSVMSMYAGTCRHQIGERINNVY